MCDGEALRLEHFPAIFSQKPFTEEVPSGLKGSVRKFERDTILKALESAGQDKNRAANLLGMSLSSLYRKMTELGIS
jgi:DNA-binding NtrC family response regulator